MSETEVNILFFGALKQYFPSRLKLKASFPLTPESLKQELAGTLTDKTEAALALLEESAVATESEVIPKGKAIGTCAQLALLPPVCGG